MPDFLEKKLADEFHDNCVYVVENLNFHPEEFSTFEPKVEEVEEKEGTGDKAEDEEEIKRLASREKGSR